MKEQFKQYIDKALERFLVMHELKGNNEDIKAFCVMLQIDAMTSQPPSSPYWQSVPELTNAERKKLKDFLTLTK